MNKLSSIKKDLSNVSSRSRAEASKRFFKTAKGQYGYGDMFIGIKVPDQRIVARKYKNLSLIEIKKLLSSKVHEYRLTALLILVLQYKSANTQSRMQIVKFYLTHKKWVNNWDLVDSSAGYILGDYLSDKKDRKILYKLVTSQNIWDRRIAIVATQAFIAKNDFRDTLRLAEILLTDTHDLIHKATGWMLREVGKRSLPDLKKFLDKHAHEMPRTMLRYAIEKFSEVERNHYIESKLIKI